MKEFWDVLQSRWQLVNTEVVKLSKPYVLKGYRHTSCDDEMHKFAPIYHWLWRRM